MTSKLDLRTGIQAVIASQLRKSNLINCCCLIVVFISHRVLRTKTTAQKKHQLWTGKQDKRKFHM